MRYLGNRFKNKDTISTTENSNKTVNYLKKGRIGLSKIEDRIKELGLELPPPATPLANYVSVVRDGDLLYMSGAGAVIKGKALYTGKLGAEVSIEDGYDAARISALNLISILKKVLGDLDKVEQIVKLLGFVASTPDFYQQPAVINGASDVLAEVFGDKGKHARTAIGTSVLPMNMPVEIEMIVRIKD